MLFFFFKQKTAYEMRISDWSSDVCSSDLACAFAAADGLELPLHRHCVDAVVRQREEERDAIREIVKRAFERFALAWTLNSGRIFDAPMGGDRVARPDRAGFARGIVANGEDEIELGRARRREFVPALRAQPARVKAESARSEEHTSELQSLMR